MAEPSTLESILNIVIPFFVILFLFWVIYRIPIIKEAFNWCGDKIKGLRERGDDKGYTQRTQTIQYE